MTESAEHDDGQHSQSQTELDSNDQGDHRTNRRVVNSSTPAVDASASNHAVEESSVAEQAPAIVEHFMTATYEIDLEDGVIGSGEYGEALNPAENAPTGSAQVVSIPELEHMVQQQHTANSSGTPIPYSTSVRIGERLARLGDQFQEQHGHELDGYVEQLLPTLLNASADFRPGNLLNEAYQAFKSVAANLFSDGVISWGRVIALMCFGYRMSVALFKHGWRNFMPKVVQLVVNYMVDERIVHWIASNGGWIAALAYRFPFPTGPAGQVLQYLGGIVLFSALLVSIFTAVRNTSTK